MSFKQKTAFFILLIISFMGSVQLCMSQQKVNIKTLLWMLPKDVLSELMPNKDKKAIEANILICDYKNGYIELLGSGQFTWEMC